MAPATKLERFRYVSLTVLLAAVLAGCGGTSRSNRTHHTPAAARPSLLPAHGGDAVARRVLSRVAGALSRLHSFHIHGVGRQIDGAQLVVDGDFELPGRLHLTLRQGLEQIEVILVRGYAYVRGNRAFWITHGPAVANRLTNRWVKINPAQSDAGVFLAFTNPRTIGRCLVEQHLGSLSIRGTSMVRGRQAIVIVDQGNRPGSQPGRLYVARHGPPLPLRAVETGPQRPGGRPDRACGETGTTPATTLSSQTTITAFNEPVSIKPPRGALNVSGAPAA